MFPGMASKKSEFGQSQEAHRFRASNLGMVLPARWTLTGSSLKNPALHIAPAETQISRYRIRVEQMFFTALFNV
jgi:hypothetical protein